MSEDGIERDGFQVGDHVIVTGGGGGFGRAFAKRFARMGARVSIWEIDPVTGPQTLAEVLAAGGDAKLFEVDLADAQAIAVTARNSSLAYGTPYCIVNNASIFPRASLLDMTIDTFDTTLKVNVTAPFQIIQAFGPEMIARRRGVILNVASGRALEGAVNGASYACSKAAILSLTKTVALEWARYNIRCNCIIPGVSLTAQPLAVTTEEELLERGKTRIPLGRVGYPEDVAGLAAWLVSSDAAYMTGQGVAMNGGAVLVPQ